MDGMVENIEFKVTIIRKFHRQINAAYCIGIKQSNLSAITRGYRPPSQGELQKLRLHFTPGQLRRWFGKVALAKAEVREEAS